jgi:hypothetical protein
MDEAKMSELITILYRLPSGKFVLWACRGEGKGCKRNRYRSSQKPCGDCLGPLPENWTLQQVIEHLNRGDA